VSLDNREVEVVVAPHSQLSTELHSGHLRELRWPARHGEAPRAWVALVAPPGLGPEQVAALRRQAQSLCTGPAWTQTLRGDGLAPAPSSSGRLNRFVSEGIGEATDLQALAAKIVRDY
jgi:hypothetical protein